MTLPYQEAAPRRDFVYAFTKTYCWGVSTRCRCPRAMGGSTLRGVGDLVIADPAARQDIPDATVARLPQYLRALSDLVERGVASVSSEELAAAAGVRSAKLRRDLSHLGSYGVRGVGYEVEMLAHEITRELGLAKDWPVAIVGLGNLGHALAAYLGLATRGFQVVALMDRDPDVIGQEIAGMIVGSVDDLERIVTERGVAIGVIATPAASAQEVCDRFVAVGVRSVLNFAPCVLSVPEGVDVRKVDLSTELQILAFHEQRKVPAAQHRMPLLEVAP
jgi:redox-sensing transcriptional repressor